MKRADLARMIDHTLLKPESVAADVAALVAEAAELGTFSVCVSPNQLPFHAPDGVAVATVCGFPSGAHSPQVKALEAASSVTDGADEVDMVVNLKLVKEAVGGTRNDAYGLPNGSWVPGASIGAAGTASAQDRLVVAAYGGS